MSRFDRLREWVRQRSTARESDSDYDGLFSYASEFHAFIIGLGAGTSAVLLNQTELAGAAIALALGVKVGVKFKGDGVAREISKEPWYGIGGVLIGVPLGRFVPPLVERLHHLDLLGF